jgi:hypothetical protein
MLFRFARTILRLIIVIVYIRLDFNISKESESLNLKSENKPIN